MAVITLDSIRQPIGDTGFAMGSVDMAGMSVISHHWPAGFDVTDLLRAACGDILCPVQHYFIVTKGSAVIRYTDDGSEETVRAGDVAYARPGHTVRAVDALDMVEISPADGNNYLMARIAASGALG